MILSGNQNLNLTKYMTPNTQITPKELRNFGLTLAAVIGVLFGLVFPTIFDWSYINYSWLFVIYLLLSALTFPKSLKFVYTIFSWIGRILNWINTKIILGIIFIFLFIPIALFFKLIARDLLRKKFDSSAKSYRELPDENKQKIDLTKPY